MNGGVTGPKMKIKIRSGYEQGKGVGDEVRTCGLSGTRDLLGEAGKMSQQH